MYFENDFIIKVWDVDLVEISAHKIIVLDTTLRRGASDDLIYKIKTFVFWSKFSKSEYEGVWFKELTEHDSDIDNPEIENER